MFYFLPILGGQKTAVLDLAEGWCAAPGLFPSHYPLISAWTTGRMDRGRMTGQMTERTGSGAASFVIPTSFNVCNDMIPKSCFCIASSSTLHMNRTSHTLIEV